MTDKEYKYYFGCGFAWWVIHIFYRPFESVKEELLQSVQDRIDEFDEQAEKTAAWLLDEVAKPGLDFVIDKKEVTMFACLEASEPIVKKWMHELINVMHQQKIEDEGKQYEYLYCLLIGWQLYMIMVAEKYLNNLQPEGKEQRQQLIHPFANWLLNEWDNASRTFLSISAEELMKNELARKTYEEIAMNWHLTIEETLKKYRKADKS